MNENPLDPNQNSTPTEDPAIPPAQPVTEQPSQPTAEPVAQSAPEPMPAPTPISPEIIPPQPSSSNSPDPSQQPQPPQPSQKPKKSKKPFIISTVIIVIVALIALTVVLVCDHLENQRLDAESVLLKSDLTVEFGSELKVSDCIASLQGELVNDFAINTEQLGEQEITFEYINIKNRKRPSKVTITVVDTVKPSIFGGDAYTLYTGYKGELTDLMLSVDNLDDRPTREIRGKYNLEKPGTYALEYVITDASENQTIKPFTLTIIDPPEDADEEPESVTERIPISRVIRLHKTDQTRIGIDISQWQGEIDWQKVKEAGVEFAMLRIGYQYGFGGENVLDPYFKANLDGAKTNHIPVGVYYYSYAKTPDEAKSQAEWILNMLGGTELELGIAFDWENWATFNSIKMSIYTINKTAEAFFNVVRDVDYKPVLYSSKNYLDLIWQPEKLAEKFDDLDIWLAQYYDYVTYRGDYQIWQMTDSGTVPGIEGPVDLDIIYKTN